MSRVALIGHPACERHDTGPDHPDDPRRLAALAEAVRADGALAGVVEERTAVPAGEEDLLRVHAPGHVERVRDAALRARAEGSLVWLDADTPVSPGSWDAALAAAGCAISATEAVLDGSASAAFALSRPPGHHASPDRAMGFCLFNNVAVAVRRAQVAGRVRRALVLDLDAHHGNGTQDAFWEDPDVYVVCVHLGPHEYPGSGGADERGAGRGEGTTLNVPLAPGTTAAVHRARTLEALDVALTAFTPELVFLSLGFDCLAGDPEGGFLLAPRDFHRLTAEILARLPPPARGRVVGVLEGGYALELIGSGLANALRALAGLPPA